MKLGRAPRALVLMAATALFAGSIAACSPEPAGTGQPGEGSSPDAYQALITSGPVADEATVSASTWATAVKQAGVLRIGGTETSELFSLLDPVSAVPLSSSIVTPAVETNVRLPNWNWSPAMVPSVRCSPRVTAIPRPGTMPTTTTPAATVQ